MLKHRNKDNSLETTLYHFKNCDMPLEKGFTFSSMSKFYYLSLYWNGMNFIPEWQDNCIIDDFISFPNTIIFIIITS